RGHRVGAGRSRRFPPLVPVALQARVRLPDRYRGLVRRALLVHLRTDRRDELLLPRAPLDDRAPFAQPPAELGQVRGGLGDDAEVDERKPLRRAALDLVQARLPGFEVELGWGSRRHDVAGRLDANACRVARVEGSVAIDVADVVSCVAWGGAAL